MSADDRSIWIDHSPTSRSGIEWADIYQLSGHKIDGQTEIFTCIVLDTDYGEFMELFASWPGFPDVVAAITQNIPGIDPNWFQMIEHLGVDDPPLLISQRSY